MNGTYKSDPYHAKSLRKVRHLDETVTIRKLNKFPFLNFIPLHNFCLNVLVNNQIVHFFFEIIFEFGSHLKALLNSSKFDNTPLTRKRSEANLLVFNAGSNKLLFRASQRDCKHLKSCLKKKIRKFEIGKD